MASDEDDGEFKPARCPPLPRSYTALHPPLIHIKVLTQRPGKEYRGKKQGWLILNTRPSLFVEIHHEFTGHFNSAQPRELILGHQPLSKPCSLAPGEHSRVWVTQLAACATPIFAVQQTQNVAGSNRACGCDYLNPIFIYIIGLSATTLANTRSRLLFDTRNECTICYIVLFLGPFDSDNTGGIVQQSE